MMNVVRIEGCTIDVTTDPMDIPTMVLRNPKIMQCNNSEKVEDKISEAIAKYGAKFILTETIDKLKEAFEYLKTLDTEDADIHALMRMINTEINEHSVKTVRDELRALGIKQAIVLPGNREYSENFIGLGPRKYKDTWVYVIKE